MQEKESRLYEDSLISELSVNIIAQTHRDRNTHLKCEWRATTYAIILQIWLVAFQAYSAATSTFEAPLILEKHGRVLSLVVLSKLSRDNKSNEWHQLTDNIYSYSKHAKVSARRSVEPMKQFQKAKNTLLWTEAIE